MLYLSDEGMSHEIDREISQESVQFYLSFLQNLFLDSLMACGNLGSYTKNQVLAAHEGEALGVFRTGSQWGGPGRINYG